MWYFHAINLTDEPSKVTEPSSAFSNHSPIITSCVHLLPNQRCRSNYSNFFAASSVSMLKCFDVKLLFGSINHWGQLSPHLTCSLLAICLLLSSYRSSCSTVLSRISRYEDGMTCMLYRRMHVMPTHCGPKICSEWQIYKICRLSYRSSKTGHAENCRKTW